MALRLPSLSSLTCIQDVGILDDGDVEDSETFTLSLSSSGSNVVYSNRNATVTIVDNDGMLLFYLSGNVNIKPEITFSKCIMQLQT